VNGEKWIAGMFVALVALVAVTAAAAQAPRIEIGGGYQFLRQDDVTSPHGFAIDVAASVTTHLAVIGETGWSHHSTTPFGFTQQTTALHGGGGIRWRLDREHRLSPFAQTLAGGQRDRIDIKELGGDGVSNLFVQPGAGLDLRIHKGQSVFAEIDLRHLFDDSAQSANALRVLVGLHIGLR
jgi:hypothetical protein